MQEQTQAAPFDVALVSRETGYPADLVAMLGEAQCRKDPYHTATYPKGRINFDSGRKVVDVVREMNVRLRAVFPITDDSYVETLNISRWPDPLDTFAIPTTSHWWACFVVKGGSEGWYVHLDLILREEDRHKTIAMVKEWSLADALAVSNEVTRMLCEW